MGKYEPIPSFSPENQFRVTCPVFGVQTEIRVCFRLRDLLWSGKRQEVRRGCQACLHDSKCPIVPILQETMRTGADPGYYAREPRNGQFQEKHLRRIQNVVVMDRTMNDYGVSDGERAAIKAVSVYGAKLRGATLAELEEIKLPARKPAEKKPATPSSAVIEAATTGDLGAAISRGEAA